MSSHYRLGVWESDCALARAGDSLHVMSTNAKQIAAHEATIAKLKTRIGQEQIAVNKIKIAELSKKIRTDGPNRPKQQVAVRFRAARVDATVASITRRIERDYQLPKGSVRLVLPSGRRAHGDGKIENLLNRWSKV